MAQAYFLLKKVPTYWLSQKTKTKKLSLNPKLLNAMNIDCRTMHLFLDERPLELNVTQGLKL